MKELFEIAHGSIIGQNHRNPLLPKNNQDAYKVLATDSSIVAVVTDGCSGSRYSEVGARLGATIIAEKIRDKLEQRVWKYHAAHLSWALPNTFWKAVQHDALAILKSIAEHMGEDLRESVSDYFLFSTVGVLITPQYTYLFNVGDGVIITNNETKILGPFPNNAPPYLAYGLIPEHVPDFTEKEFQFCVESFPTSHLQNCLIGTDGAIDLINCAGKNLPGSEKVFEGVEQFWQQDRYFKNPDLVRRTLTLLNKESISPNWDEQRLEHQNGLLLDDTTIIVIRQKSTPEG